MVNKHKHSWVLDMLHCDHKYGTEAEWAPWIHVIFWQSSTHILWPQTWHRSRMSTMDASDNQALTPCDHKYGTETEWTPWMHVEFRNQALTSCDHKYGTEAEWAPWMHVEFRNQALTSCDYKYGTEAGWAPWWMWNLLIKYSPTMITNVT